MENNRTILFMQECPEWPCLGHGLAPTLSLPLQLRIPFPYWSLSPHYLPQGATPLLIWLLASQGTRGPIATGIFLAPSAPLFSLSSCIFICTDWHPSTVPIAVHAPTSIADITVNISPPPTPYTTVNITLNMAANILLIWLPIWCRGEYRCPSQPPDIDSMLNVDTVRSIFLVIYDPALARV